MPGETGNFPGVGYELLAVAGPSPPSLIEEEAAGGTTAAAEWKITVEGTDAFGEIRRHEILVDKSWDRLQRAPTGQGLHDSPHPDRLRDRGGSQSPLDAVAELPSEPHRRLRAAARDLRGPRDS
jgi:hypothetical protein